MWTCNNCENQNEENFKFCWSCGKPQTFVVDEELDTDIPVSKPMEYELENNVSPIIETKQTENAKTEIPKTVDRKKPAMVVIQPIKHESPKIPVKKIEIKEEKPNEPEIKPETKMETAEETKKQKTTTREPELFSTFLSESERGKVFTESETDWEIIIFTTVVRLIGLYFIFLVLTSIPTLVSAIYIFVSAPNMEIAGLSDLFANALFILVAKILFYLILGIYLIASGRLILWFLPRK